MKILFCSELRPVSINENKTRFQNNTLWERGLFFSFQKSKMDFMVTPWISHSEWEKVYNLIISLETCKLRQAEEIISAWQSRVYRLPTGIFMFHYRWFCKIYTNIVKLLCCQILHVNFWLVVFCSVVLLLTNNC